MYNSFNMQVKHSSCNSLCNVQNSIFFLNLLWGCTQKVDLDLYFLRATLIEIVHPSFGKEVSFDEQVTIYCQMISQFDVLFKITDAYNNKQDVEFAMVYPK